MLKKMTVHQQQSFIEKLIPLFGEMQQEWARQRADKNKERNSRIIEALRAKARDPSVTSAEAAAFAAKADELAARAHV